MTARPDDDPTSVMTERRQLVNLAYRLLGSWAEAEDVVQETYTRWYAMTPHVRDAVDVPAAWCMTVAARICLDLLRSARARRERYVGHWLPEPLPDRHEWVGGPSGDTPTDPADRITLDESIGMAFLLVLDTMTPAERVAFVLHDVFGYPFAEIAEIVGRSPAACRQLASAGRRRVRDARPPSASSARHAPIVSRFRRAWQAKDIDALVSLLDPAGTVVADGGGHATAATDPIRSAECIARFFVDIADAPPGLTVAERTVNGRPGLVVQAGGRTLTVLAFDIADDLITHIWAVRNPHKLQHWD